MVSAPDQEMKDVSKKEESKDKEKKEDAKKTEEEIVSVCMCNVERNSHFSDGGGPQTARWLECDRRHTQAE